MGAASWQPMADRFLARADEVYPGSCQVVLHGSAARGDWVEGRSDLNLLLIADRVAPADLVRFAPEAGTFEAEQMAPPFFMAAAEWARAADAFPIEITDMRQAYRVLRGEDPVAAVTVRPEDLRRALEAEYRGKLLRLRADHALYAGRPDHLAAVVAASAGPLRVLLRATLALAGQTAPVAVDEMAKAAATLISAPAEPLATCLAHRRDAAWDCPAALFASYLGVVEQATRFVDSFTPGAS